MDLVLIFGGLTFVIAMMIFVINPPEAWVKRVFHRTSANDHKAAPKRHKQT